MFLARMALVAVSALFGIAAIAAGADPVAIVGDASLEQWEVDRELAQLISTGSFHRQVSEDTMNALECQATHRLVLKELKRQWATRHGVEVDPARVDASWREVRERFTSTDQYRAALASKGITEESFRRCFERDVAADAVDAVLLAEIAEPTRQEVEVYFILNRDEYMSPEARQVVHALVYVPPSAGRDDWLRAEEQARDLARQAAAGVTSLLDAATASLEQLPPRFRDQVGDMGFVHRGSLLPAVDDVVFAAEPGSVTEPVRSIFGYHVVQVIATRPPRPLELADVYDAVLIGLGKEQKERRLATFASELEENAIVKVAGCVDSP